MGIHKSQFEPDKHGMIGKGVKFERIRRITGYLAGNLDRFNNAKRKEEADRVKHFCSSGAETDRGDWK